MFLICLYHSPSQSQDEFETFCPNFDILLSQINDELPSTVTFAGKEIVYTGYTQITDKPTQVKNNSKSCIDLIFCTNQNNLKIQC